MSLRRMITSIVVFCCILFLDAPARAQVVCDQDFGQPAQSVYRLPYAVGRTCTCILSYCAPEPDNRHHGLFAYDFGLALGDTVTAIRGGLVYALRETDPDGTGEYHRTNYISVEHEDGTVCVYGHLTRFGVLVDIGDTIAAGQPIGLAGYSGLPADAPPCIHVEVLIDRYHWDNEDSLPFNFCNAQGPLDANGGLIGGQVYLALDPNQVATETRSWGDVKSEYRP